MEDVETLSEKIGAELINYCGDLSLEFLKRFYDRRSVVEQYLAGELALHLHGVLAGEPYCLSVTRDSDNSNSEFSNVGNGREPHMLIGIGQVPERSTPLTTSERLEPADNCLVFGVDTPEHRMVPARQPTSDLNATFPWHLWPIFNRKLRALLSSSRIQDREFINQVIQGSPQVVHCFPYQDTDNRVWWRIGGSAEGSRRIWATGDRVSCRTPELVDFVFQIHQMLLCPIYSRVDIIKGWLNWWRTHE